MKKIEKESPRIKKRAAKKTAGKAVKKKIRKNEGEIGRVVAYFSIPQAAVVEVKRDGLKSGDSIWFRGHTTDFKQAIVSMQLDGKPVQSAKKKQQIGIQVDSKVRRNDKVFKIDF